MDLSKKNYIRKSYSVVGTDKAFLKLAVWSETQKQNGHFHAILISNITGSAQNTPMKVTASFSAFFFFLKTWLILIGKNNISAQLFMSASIKYKKTYSISISI